MAHADDLTSLHVKTESAVSENLGQKTYKKPATFKNNTFVFVD